MCGLLVIDKLHVMADLGSSIPLEPAQPAQKRHFDDASQEQQPNSILGRLFKRHRPADSQGQLTIC